MRAALTALIGAATLATFAPPAAAQTAVDRADVRCILVLTVVGRDPKQAAAAQQGTFYFVGRLDGRGATNRVEPLMLSEGKAITTQAQVQAELNRCGNELKTRSDGLRAMSQRLAAQTPRPAAAAPPTK